MKTATRFLLFAIIPLMVSGCGEKSITPSGMDDYRPANVYRIAINYKAKTGDDLVALLYGDILNNQSDWTGIIGSEYCSLDIISTDQHVSSKVLYYLYRKVPHFSFLQYDEVYYLSSELFLTTSTPPENLTYHITCPAIFGDDDTHVLVTTWTDNNAPANPRANTYLECTKAIMGGEELKVTKAHTDTAPNGAIFYTYLIDIVLDK